MPVSSWLGKFDGGTGLSVEVAPADAGFAAAGLDETLAVALKDGGLDPTFHPGPYALCHGLSLTVSEDPRLGEGETHG